MEKYLWGKLTSQQIGAYTEYFVKMELTMYGFQVYGTEVDDRGIDFVARYGNAPFIQIQVKSVRSIKSPVYIQKTKFSLHEQNYLALGLLFERQPPLLYLIPSTRWQTLDKVFVGPDYEDGKSKPEWGLRVSQKNLQLFEQYRFDATVERLITQSSGE